MEVVGAVTSIPFLEVLSAEVAAVIRHALDTTCKEVIGSLTIHHLFLGNGSRT